MRSGEAKGQLGYAVTVDPDGKNEQTEEDTFSCGHCNRIVHCKPFKDGSALGARCTCCDKLICLPCVGKGCMPLEKALDLYEKRNEFRRQFLQCLGD